MLDIRQGHIGQGPEHVLGKSQLGCMRHLKVIIAVAFLLSANVFFSLFVFAETKPRQGQQTSVPLKVAFIGDSLTQGYGVKLEEAFPALLQEAGKANGYQVQSINAGVSGALSSEGPARMRWQLRSSPDAVVIALGANDGLQGLSPAAVEKNLRETLEIALEKKVPVFFIGMKMMRNLGAQYVKEFERLYSRLAAEFQTKFQKGQVPFTFEEFLLQGVALNPDLNIQDGRHPNAKGHVAIVNHLKPKWLKFLEAVQRRKNRRQG